MAWVSAGDRLQRILALVPWIVGAPALTPGGWLALGLLGTVQLGVAYWLYARAIKHVTALLTLG